MNPDEEFNDWLNSDNVVKTKEGYVTQCTLYRKTFTLDKLREYFNKEYLVV